MNKRFKLIAAAAVLILAAVALGWYFVREPADHDRLVLFGNVDIRQVALAFNYGERIAEMRAQEGDRVEAGEVIARLDVRALMLQIAETQARIGVQEQVLLRLKNGTRPEEVAQVRAENVAARAEADLCGTANQPVAGDRASVRRTGGQPAGYRQRAVCPPGRSGAAGKPQEGFAAGPDRSAPRRHRGG